MSKIPKRGDIYLVQLDPRSGSEQKGLRPFLIISRNTFSSNPQWRTLSGIPISRAHIQERRGSICIFLPQGEAGLKQESLVLCHQITTLDKNKLLHYLGTVSLGTLKEIETGIQTYLDF